MALDDVDLSRFKRLFPFSLDVERCPECGDWMERDYVHDPISQDHWRGVEAWVCEDCDYAEYTDAVDTEAPTE